MKQFIYENPGGTDMLSVETASLLVSISRWAKFLSIVGFVVVGLMVLSIITTGTMISSVNSYMNTQPGYPGGYAPGYFSWGYAIAILIFILVYLIPMIYLFQFSNRVQKAFEGRDNVTLSDAFVALQKHYTFIGILVAIWLVFMVAAIIFAMIGVAGI